MIYLLVRIHLPASPGAVIPVDGTVLTFNGQPVTFGGSPVTI